MSNAKVVQVVVREFVDGDPFAVALLEQGVTQIAFESRSRAERIVLCIPAGKRTDLAMALLKADGAAVNVQLRWSRPKKTKAKKARST